MYPRQGIIATTVACAALIPRQRQQILSKNKTYLQCNLFQVYGELLVQSHQIICPCTEGVRVCVLSEQMVESYAQSKHLDLGNAPFADTEVLQAKIRLVL